MIMAYVCVRCDVTRTKKFPEDWDKEKMKYTEREICKHCGGAMTYLTEDQKKGLGLDG